jgi:hypothetical protein
MRRFLGQVGSEEALPSKKRHRLTEKAEHAEARVPKTQASKGSKAKKRRTASKNVDS